MDTTMTHYGHTTYGGSNKKANGGKKYGPKGCANPQPG